MATGDNVDTTISCLQHAIADAQESIRAYDAKSEILGVLLTLAIGITNFTFFEHSSGCQRWLILSSWVVVPVAIFILGLVLYPRNDPFKNIDKGNFIPSGTYFLTNLSIAPQNTVTALSAKATGTDWVQELMYESMKLSVIRDRKHCWFKWGLRLSGLAIILIALSVISGM